MLFRALVSLCLLATLAQSVPAAAQQTQPSLVALFKASNGLYALDTNGNIFLYYGKNKGYRHVANLPAGAVAASALEDGDGYAVFIACTDGRVFSFRPEPKSSSGEGGWIFPVKQHSRVPMATD